MAAELSSSSTLASIEIARGGFPLNIRTLIVFDGDGDGHVIEMNYKSPQQDKSPAPDSQLAILRTLFAASSITPTLAYYPDGVTYANMESFGYINPLKANSYDQALWRQMAMAPGYGQEFERDGDTGKIKAKLQHDVEPGLSVSENGEIEVPLNRWFAWTVRDQPTSDIVGIAIDVDAGENISEGDLDEAFLPVKALRDLFEANRESGDAFGSDLSVNSSWNSRVISLPDTGDSAEMTIDSFGVSLSGTKVIRVSMRLIFLQASTVIGAHEYSAMLNQYLWSLTQVVSTTAKRVPTRIGAKHEMLYSRGLVGGNAIVELNNGLLTMRTPSRKTLVGAGDGISTDFFSLPIVGVARSDGETHLLPIVKDERYYNSDVCHYSGAGTTDRLKLEKPTRGTYEGHHAKWEVHNDSDHNLPIVDPESSDESDVMHILRPGQECEILLLKKPDGYGEVLFTRVTARRLVYTLSTEYNGLDRTQTLLESAYRNMPLPMYETLDTSDPSQTGFQYDPDAFKFGTGSIDDGDGSTNWNTKTDWDHDRAFQLKWPGELILEFNCGIQIQPGATAGGASGTNRIRWYGMRDGYTKSDYSLEIAAQYNDGFSGLGTIQPYSLSGRKIIPAEMRQDAWIQGFYNRAAGGYNEDHLEMAYASLNVTFHPVIRKEYIQ